ncbi:MAG TPA: TetR/AcrR family transcriptional regulator [Gemmataceae bacterium]|nr:TetR/AcrR family transcriptional regulator [Gemmataceae bacterium]
MKKQSRSARPRGRPSSAAIDRALIAAALEEFTVRGYHAMSMESIAARAGVSKVSLYRRWSSKLAIVTEVLRFLSEVTPVKDHGSLAADIRALLKEYIGSSTAKSAAKIFMRMMGEISGNPEFLALYRTHLLAPRLAQLRSLVERARARKELRANLPTDVACAMIAGSLFLYYLTLLAEAEVDMSSNLVEQLTRAILSGIRK